MLSEDEYDSERYDSDADDDDDDDEASEGGVEKREYHNLLERKRRGNLKDSFAQLRDTLPCFKKKKYARASRVQILKKACEFLRKKDKLRKILAEAYILAEENRILSKALAEYNAAIANEDWETVERIEAMDLPLEPRPYLPEADESDTEESESESSVEDGSSPDHPPVDSDSSSGEEKGTEDADLPSREAKVTVDSDLQSREAKGTVDADLPPRKEKRTIDVDSPCKKAKRSRH